jgi:DNA polymerase-3 subunit gamma/tau
VKAAEGSMRDAQSLMDQVISFGGQDVEAEDVRDILGFIPNEILNRTLDAIASGDSREIVNAVGIVVDQGLGPQQYVRELIGRMRDLLMVKLGLKEKVLGSDEDRDDLTRRGEDFSEQDLIRFFDLLLRLENDLKWTSQPRFHLEVGLVKLVKARHMRDIEEVLIDLKGGAAAQPAVRTPASPLSTSPSPPISPKPDTRASSAGGAAKAAAANAVTDTKTRPALELNSDTVRPAGGTNSTPSEPTVADNSSLNSAREEPLVKRFLEVFRGDIAQVKPPRGESQ